LSNSIGISHEGEFEKFSGANGCFGIDERVSREKEYWDEQNWGFQEYHVGLAVGQTRVHQASKLYF